MIYQGVHYGRRGGVGSDGDAMRAGVVEGTGGDGADGDDDGLVLRGGQSFAAGERGEIVYGAGAEEKDGVGLAIDHGVYAGVISAVRGYSAIGDNFGEFCAERSKGCGKIRIGAIAAGKENGFVAQAIAK